MQTREGKIAKLVFGMLVSEFGGRLKMIQKWLLMIFASILLTLSITPSSNAAYFVFNKKGNIRSGPGTKYRVIGQLANETIAEIPETFNDFKAKWIAIDAKTELDKKTKAKKVVFTKWVHRSLGVVIQGDLNEVDKYFAVKESGWPKEIQDLILAGKVVVGMNTHMVFYAWGRPDRVEEKSATDESSEMWVYEKQGLKTQHLHFRDGILTKVKYSQN